MMSHFRPKYVTFDCYGTLTNFQMAEAAQDLYRARLPEPQMAALVRDFAAYRLDEILGDWKPYADVIHNALERACKRNDVAFKADHAQMWLQLAQAKSEGEQAKTEREQVFAQLTQAQAETAQAQAETAQAQAETAQARADAAQARAEGDQAKSVGEQAKSDHTQALAQLAQARAEAEQAKAESAEVCAAKSWASETRRVAARRSIIRVYWGGGQEFTTATAAMVAVSARRTVGPREAGGHMFD